MPNLKSGYSKVKFESHLTLALKKKIKDLKTEVQIKVEEVENLKRNIKSTKIQEYEVEVKMYVDESMRLRH